LLSFQAWAQEEVWSVEGLSDQLAHCRSQPERTWTISGFDAAQTQMPAQVPSSAARFYPAVAYSNPDEKADPQILSRADVLAALVTQIKDSQCPVEVIGYASSEGGEQQNIDLASDRRAYLIDALLDGGLGAHAIYQGDALIATDAYVLKDNRRVLIRTRPDLAWQCSKIEGAQDLFPVEGRLRFSIDDLSGDVNSVIRDAWGVVSADLLAYPCQYIAQVHISDALNMEVQPALGQDPWGDRAVTQTLTDPEMPLEISFGVPGLED